MAKPKKGKGQGSGVIAITQKCTCEHPFTCTCGNRPPRPSKGHKWDPEQQAWGGKGHKQKGASGQTASVSQAAQTTQVGKTQVAQWQRLPTQLLNEVCQRLKRKPPKYKNIETKDGSFKYRVVIPDAKDPEKDLMFVPAHAVQNEEQANEEAALLALLHLTPNLPHERKLPDPYKTTWLNAVQSKKGAGNDKAQGKKNDSSECTQSKAQTTPSTGATASSNLAASTTYASKAEKLKQIQDKRRQQNERIRRHEAMRLANQNHQVFLSARLRQQIEAILRDNSADLNEFEDDCDDTIEDTVDISDVQRFVEERLHAEGFTRRQARTAFQQQDRSDDSVTEDEWDIIYEKCLQWLLVNLDEDKLPVGFSPVGGTLDVIASTTPLTISDATKVFADQLGLRLEDAAIVEQRAKKQGHLMNDAFWEILHEFSKVPIESFNGAECSNECIATLNDELDVLKAMYTSDECNIHRENGFTTVTIRFAEATASLEVVLKDGYYPTFPPTRALIKGGWSSSLNGVAINAALVSYISTLPSGEPMVFELYNHTQALLDDPNLEARSLLDNFTAKSFNQATISDSKTNTPALKKRTVVSIPSVPRERGGFWAVHPCDTPPAVAFPDITANMKTARNSLPAAKVRSDFLRLLKQADAGGRVMLVTGDTGCGKTVSEAFATNKIFVYPSGVKLLTCAFDEPDHFFSDLSCQLVTRLKFLSLSSRKLLRMPRLSLHSHAGWLRLVWQLESQAKEENHSLGKRASGISFAVILQRAIAVDWFFAQLVYFFAAYSVTELWNVLLTLSSMRFTRDI